MNARGVLVIFTCYICLAFTRGEVDAQSLFRQNEILAKDRPEAWAMKLVGSELQMTPLGVTRTVRPWSIEVGFDAEWIPSLSTEQRFIGFNGTKEEDVNRTSALGRPRVRIGLPRSFSVEVGYIPPVTISGVKPNVFTWALDRPIASRSWWRLGGRVYGLAGHISGDITCDAATVAAGSDPVRNPYKCEAPSNDEIRIHSVGVELLNGFAVTPRLEPFVATGWNYFSNRFQVNALYSGILDESLLLTNGPTFSLTTGITYRLAERIRISGEAFYTPLDVRRQGIRTGDSLVNVRAGAYYLIR